MIHFPFFSFLFFFHLLPFSSRRGLLPLCFSLSSSSFAANLHTGGTHRAGQRVEQVAGATRGGHHDNGSPIEYSQKSKFVSIFSIFKYF
jgi:hypothetical protein